MSATARTATVGRIARDSVLSPTTAVRAASAEDVMRRNWGKVAAFAALAAVFVAVPGVGDVAEAQAGWQSGDGLIGNRIWADTDGDGIQDPNESGQEGVVVDLYSDTNQHLARGASGPGGWWGYPNLTTGRCYVVFVQLQGGQANSPRQAGTDMTKDSDFGTDSRTRVCLTADSPVRTDVDAGFTVPNLPFWARGNAGLGNRVWNDLDRDGIQDPGGPASKGSRSSSTHSATGTGTTTSPGTRDRAGGTASPD